MDLYDDELAASVTARYEGRPAHERPMNYDLATDAANAEQRAWMNEAFKSLPPEAQTKVKARLLSGDRHMTAVNELAVAHVLQALGWEFEYETDLGGRTPDFVVRASTTRPALLIEVWTREPPREILGERRSWNALRRRVMDIPQPVGLLVSHVDQTKHAAPPSAGEAKKIARALRRWLLGAPRYRGEICIVDELRFVVAMDLPGVTAALGDPTHGGSTTADQIIEAVDEKVRRYRSQAQSEDADLVIAVGGAPDGAISADLVHDAMIGKNTTTIAISPFASGPIHAQQIKMRPDSTPPAFDPALAAVAWIDTSGSVPALDLLAPASARRHLDLPAHPILRWATAPHP